MSDERRNLILPGPGRKWRGVHGPDRRRDFLAGLGLWAGRPVARHLEESRAERRAVDAVAVAGGILTPVLLASAWTLFFGLSGG